MIASNKNWIKRNAPSLKSLCMLALLSMLIGAPAFLMIRLLEPRLILPAAQHSAFLARSDRHHCSRLDPRRQKFEKYDTVGYCRRTSGQF